MKALMWILIVATLCAGLFAGAAPWHRAPRGH